MADTEQERQAQHALDEAVDTFMRESGWAESGVLTAWVLVGHQAGFDDGEETVTYPIVYSRGAVPDHVALGLLDIARDAIHGCSRYRRTGEEPE